MWKPPSCPVCPLQRKSILCQRPQIVTTRSSSVRVAVLRGPGEDVEEWLIPEQLSSRVIDGKLVSTVLDKIW